MRSLERKNMRDIRRFRSLLVALVEFVKEGKVGA